MRKKSLGLVFALAPFLFLPSAAVSAGWAEKEFRPHPAYALLEKLVRILPQMSVLQASSHNKKGVNGDAGWPLYKDSHGDEVIFDAAGPGCLKSL